MKDSSTAPALSLGDHKSAVAAEKKLVTKHRETRIPLPTEVTSKALVRFNGGEIAGLVHNVSMFGVRIAVPKEDCFIASNTDVSLRIEVSNQLVFDGIGRVITETASGARIELGLALVQGSIDLDLIRGILGEMEMRPKLVESTSVFSIASKISPIFKEQVADLNTLYQDLRIRLIEEERRIAASALNDAHKKRLEEHAINLAMSLYFTHFIGIFGKFQSIVDGFSLEENALHKRYFRTNFSPLVNNAPFVKRAFEKPLGYAGDYGLMIMFYEYDDLGGDLFDKFIHRFACNQPAAVANKNRVELLSELLHKHVKARSSSANLKVTSIACGPARELQLFLQDAAFAKTDKVQFVIADQEPLALDHAAKKLKILAQQKEARVDVVALREDVVLGTIKQRPFVEEFRHSDMVISAGLFDYLSDRVATKLIGCLFEYVKPGGELIIGNVSDKNPDRFSMDYFMEWNLLLRSPGQLLELVPEEVRASGAEIEVISESLGLNLFLRVRKKH